MPTYEYRCERCTHEYEKREGFDAPARQRCPKCGGKALRILYAAPIVFKGSGFYVTDSRKTPSDGEAAPKPEPAKKADDSSKDVEQAAAS